MPPIRQDTVRSYRRRDDDAIVGTQTDLPDLFVVGAAKSGTTALYHYFKVHPQVFVPAAIKETNYMAFYNGLPPLAGPGDKIALCGQSITTLPEYQALYRGRKAEVAAADVSPAYLYYPQVPERIAKLCPTAKIVMILRNPIDCTFSMYAMMRRDGREPCRTFAEAFAESPARMAAGWEWAWDYQRGFVLADRVAAYLRAFPKQQVFIRRYEELQNHPQRFYRELNSFAGIDDIDLGAANKRENTSPTRGQMLRKKKLGRWMLRTARVAGWLTPPALKNNLRQRFLAPPAFALIPADRRMLLAHFEPEIKRLAQLLAWDLDDWLDH
jgi:Sulfotransferase domain